MRVLTGCRVLRHRSCSNFSDVVGSKCGALLPTGAVQEEIDGVPVSCIDVAMPMVIMRAGDLGHQRVRLG